MIVDIVGRVDSDLREFIQRYIDRLVREKPWKNTYEPQLRSRFEDNERQVHLQTWLGGI